MLLNGCSRMRSIHNGIYLTKTCRSPTNSLSNRPGHVSPLIATLSRRWPIRCHLRLVVYARWYDLLALAPAAEVERSRAGRASHEDLPGVIVAQGGEGLLPSLSLASRACSTATRTANIVLRVHI